MIIVLSGSNGGLSENRAQLLASHGFAVLALGYFGVEGLPDLLENIPLEYFETAFEWIHSQDYIDSKHVGIYGVSRGAELALLLAAQFPESIHSVVATAPSSVVFAALGDERIPAWTYHEKPVLPDAPVPITELENGKGQTPEFPLTTTPHFLKGMEDRQAFEAAAIPVEKIQCPLLLISGGDDLMWPSQIFAEQILNRLASKGSKISCTHLNYPNAGHQINIPYIPTVGSTYYHPFDKHWFSMGGSPKEDDLASRDSWKKLIAFFNEQLLEGP